MARENLALLDLAREFEYNALAISCWSKFQKVCDIAVCGVLSRLNQAGVTWNEHFNIGSYKDGTRDENGASTEKCFLKPSLPGNIWKCV